MATTTPNNSWPVPTSTDYVKDGAADIEALGDAIDTSAGNTWLPWTSFTPTWSGLTIGNGVYDYSKYQIIGKTAFVNIRFSLGSTSAVTGDLVLTLPANLTRNSLNGLNSTAVFGDLGTANYIGIITQSGASTTQWFVRPINAASTYAVLGACSATVPHIWGVNDTITFNVSYEVA
jgi:hypothetical protein